MSTSTRGSSVERKKTFITCRPRVEIGWKCLKEQTSGGSSSQSGAALASCS